MTYVRTARDRAFFDHTDLRPHAERTTAERLLVIDVVSEGLATSGGYSAVDEALRARVLAHAAASVARTDKPFNGDEVLHRYERILERFQWMFGENRAERLAREEAERAQKIAEDLRTAKRAAAAAHKAGVTQRKIARQEARVARRLAMV